MVILVMHAAEMAEAGDANGQNVRAREQALAIDELHLGRVADDGRAAGDGVADFLKFAIRVIHPRTFGFPISDRRDEFAGGFHLAVDAGVIRHFHLIDRDRIRLKRDGFGNGFAPLFLRLLDHAGDEINVDLREANLAGKGVSAGDFLRAMRAAIDFEDVIVEVFDAEREPRDAEVADGLQFVIGERAGFGLERDFLDFVPRQQAFHAVGEKLQLVGRKIAGVPPPK